MPSIKDLKKRITSTKNTQQTTRAMKMVSAAKLRRAQDAIANQRPYAKNISDLIVRLASLDETMMDSALQREEGVGTEEGGPKRVLLLVITSDRGLCGAFNGNVLKATQRWLASESSKYASVQLAFVGRKGYEFFRSRKVNQGPYFADVGGKVTFAKAKKLADGLVEMYRRGEVDEVKVVYNEFKNAVTQQVVVENYLPVRAPATATADAPGSAGADSLIYIVRPNRQEVFRSLIEKNFSIQAFRYLLESQAGEHGARMSAMENATKNAGEMIRKLTLLYNKQRQAGITKELLEIISGSESQKSSA